MKRQHYVATVLDSFLSVGLSQPPTVGQRIGRHEISEVYHLVDHYYQVKVKLVDPPKD